MTRSRPLARPVGPSPRVNSFRRFPSSSSPLGRGCHRWRWLPVQQTTSAILDFGSREVATDEVFIRHFQKPVVKCEALFQCIRIIEVEPFVESIFGGGV